MPVSQADIDALNAALATGEHIVKYRDKQIEYRSVSDIIKARDDLLSRKLAEDAAASGARPASRLSYPVIGGRGFR